MIGLLKPDKGRVWFLTIWLTFVIFESVTYAVLSGREELLVAFLIKACAAALVWGWAPINGEVQLGIIRMNPNAFLGASQLLVGFQNLIMYAYPYDECLALPTDLVAVNLIYMGSVIAVLVLCLVADLLTTVSR